MANVQKWRTAFKEIYGRTPTKNDYNVAPQRVREECSTECPASAAIADEPEPPRKSAVRLKRPNLDTEENSPVKRRPAKARRLCGDPQGSRTSPRKSMAQSTRFISPLKSANSPNWRGSKGATGLTPLKEVQSTSAALPTPSPLHKSPTKRLLANPAFSSLFDTPEKGQTAAWGEISPMKTIVSPQKGISIRSPRKPLVHKEVLIKNVECLLLPTPEKRERKEILDPFQPEEMPKKKSAAGPKKDMAVAFSAEQGRVIKRAFKRSVNYSGIVFWTQM
ncbi:hypothetical protein COOONC_19860 [Cooperia oncophora]